MRQKMHTNRRKLITIFALTTLLFVSFVSVCRQVAMACGTACSEEMMQAVHLNNQMDGCASHAADCSTATQDHMTTFASLYPSVTVDALSLLSVAVAIYVFAWFLLFNHPSVAEERKRTRFKRFKQRVSNSLAPDFLVRAFSRGILNSKIFA